MALNAAGLNLAAAGIADGITHASLHSDAPGANGTANVIPGGRIPIELVAAGGSVTLGEPVPGAGFTPGATVAFVGLWDAATGGTYFGDAPRTTGDPAVNAAGEYTITSINIPGTSS